MNQIDIEAVFVPYLISNLLDSAFIHLTHPEFRDNPSYLDQRLIDISKSSQKEFKRIRLKFKHVVNH